MPEKRILDLSAIFDDLTPETAGDILAELMEMDMRLWMSLAEDLPHPPVSLVDLAIKAGAKLPEGVAPPTEQEKILYFTGALEPSKRVVEIAIFTANDPEALEKFRKLTAPIVRRREQVLVETMAARFGARGKKILS